MDIPLPGEIIPFPSSSPPLKSKSPPPMPPLPPDFDHIPLPPSIGKPNLSPPAVNHLSKPPPLPPTAPPLPPVASKALPILPPLPSSPKGVPSVEAKGNGEAILWSSIPPPPAPAPPSEDSKYSPSHATPADEENERMVLPPAFTLLPPPPPPSEGAPNHPPPATTLLSPPKMPPLPPQPPTRPPPPVTPAPALLRTAAAEPPPPLPAPPPPPPKTAVLGKMQAKKRLLAFSMTKQGGGLGLSFGFAKSTRVVNKASANAFVGSGEDEESAAVGERKEQGAVGKGRKKRKEEREVLAIEEIKREEERLKEALGIRQQAQRAEQWAEEMWGMAAAAPVGGAPEGMLLAAPTAALGAVGGGGGGGTAVDDASAAAAVGGEGGSVAAADAAASGALQEGAAGGGEGLRHHGDREAQEAAGGVLAEVPSNAEHGEAAKGKEEMGEGKEERKGEGVGGEKRDKKGEKGSSGRSKKDKESSGGGERSSRRRGEESGSGDKERSKRAGGKGGGGGSGGRSERRSERKRDSRRSAGVDGPPSGWKQLKDLFGGEWKGEKIPQRMSGSREDRDRDRRGSRSHSSRSRDHKRSGHSSHRSRSGSADIHRRPQPSPFFVAKGAKHGEKEFPLRLLRHTRTRPPLSYCENPETAAPPRPPTRKEAFASEPPEVVRIMRLLAEAGLEKESEGRENSKEASGLAALRVSYEGGDEEEADDEQKRSDRSWFLTLAAFLSDGSSSAASAKAAFKRSTSPEDHSPVKEKDKERKRDEDVPQEDEISADSDVSMKEEVRDDSDAKEEEEEGNEEEEEEEEEVDEGEEEEEMVVKDEIASVNEASEPTVHSKWDSDNDSGGMSAPEDGKDKATPSPEIKKEQLEVSEEEDGEKEVKRMEVEDEEVEGEEEEEDRVKEEEEEVGEEEKEAQEERREEKGPEDEGEGKKGGDDDAHPTAIVAGHSESERSVESEVSGMESEGEEKKDHQLASEYEEFMKAVSVGEEDDEDDVWEEDRARGHSAEVSDHRDSDSSERKPSKPHAVVLNRSSDVEMASDAPSSDDASTGRKNVRESSSDNEANRNSVSKEEMEKADEKAISFKEKSAKRRERSKRDNSESAADSEVEIQIPKKKRKTSGKKLASVGEGIRKKTGGDKKKKLKTKEKSDRKRKEKERKRKRKKKDRRKKKGRKRRDDSSDVESESEEDEEEEGSDSNEHAGNAKGSRSKASDGIHKRRSHRGEMSSEEVSSDSSSESSDEADRRKPRKKKRKKRKKHEKSGSKEDEEEMSDDEGDGRKGKPHSSHKKRSRETRNKYHRDSDNSDGSDGDERGTIADVKSKSADCSSVGGKENGVESGGKRGRKQKLKERGRKKKRKSSPPSLKKHASSRRRSPSTSDGSPTPGRGSHQRGNSVGKTQGSRGGTSEGGPSSIESNSSGGTKKHGDNTVQERKPSESTSRGESGRDEASSSQRKSQVSEREERRSRDSGKSKSLKDPSPLLPKGSGSASKEKGGRGGSSARKSSQESVSKKRAAEQSLNTSSSSSSSSPSSLSFSSISSSSSSTESSSSASSQSDSHSVSSSSSSSSSSASSSASSNSSSSSSSSSLSSFVNLPSSLSSLKVVSAVMEKIEPKIFKKDNNQTPPLISVKDFSKSRPLLVSPERHMSDVSFSSLSRDSSKLHLGEVHHFEESLSKRSRTPGEKCKIPVNDKKDDSQMNDSPRKRSDCGSVVSTNASECSSSEPRPAEAVRKDREPENLIDPPEPRGRTCGPFVGSEKVQLEQRDNSTPLNSTSKTNLGSRESKSLLVNPEQVTFKLCSEDDPMNGKILGDKGISSSPSQPSRPSRWDSRPVISESQVVASSGTSVGGREGVGKEWRESSHPPVVTAPVLPVPFPTCRDKPLEEIPLPSLGSVPQPVASPWGPEGLPLSGVPIVLSSAELPINPVCGLADSTISDSDLAGKGAGGGGLLQTVSESSPNAKKVSLDKPNVAVNRPTSSESEQSVVEQFPVDSNLFLKTRVNRYQDTNQQSVGDKVVESATSVFSLDKPSLAKNTESAALSGETECPMSPEADQPPTDWDDPEAFVGPGLSEIKSHVIQVGNFLQVVPSEQPIVSHSFANPSTPIPVVAPPPLAGGVAPVPVPPAAPITTVLPVAAPSSVNAVFPAPVSPVKTFQSLQPAHSSLSLVMPAVQSTPPNPPDPASPSVPPAPSSTLPSTPPPPSTPSTMLSSVLPSTPSLPSPTTSSTLSHLPLLASLAPSSSCGGMSQLPLDPATILGTLISHALALEKQQKQQQQQQNLVHSPVCSPLIGGENDEEAPNEAPRAMTRVERQARRLEKRKKMARGVSSQLYAEKFPVEDAMSNTDPLTNAMTEDYCIDPEEVALIQEAMSKVTGEEEEFEEQSPQVCRVKEKRKKPKVLCNTVLPPATRGILIPPGLREKPSFSSGGTGLNSGTQGQRKSVMFADGVRPGEGTSPSAGEDLPSPPPPVRKVPKEKRLRKKKKIKVKIIRQIRMETTEEDDDEDDDASPPPPPPGSPPPSLMIHHLSASSPTIVHHPVGGCEVPIPNPAAHYPYPSAPTIPPTHAFSQLQVQPQPATSQPQLPPLNPAGVPPPMAASGGSALPPNALPRIPQWAPCN